MLSCSCIFGFLAQLILLSFPLFDFRNLDIVRFDLHDFRWQTLGNVETSALLPSIYYDRNLNLQQTFSIIQASH